MANGVKTGGRKKGSKNKLLALRLIAFSYGSALLINTYGFLAVFAAGIALRRIERCHSEASADEIKGMPLTGEADEIATDPPKSTCVHDSSHAQVQRTLGGAYR